MLNSIFLCKRFSVFLWGALFVVFSVSCQSSKRELEEDCSLATDTFKRPVSINQKHLPETAYFYAPNHYDINGWHNGKYVEMRINQIFGEPLKAREIEQPTFQTYDIKAHEAFEAAMVHFNGKNRRKRLESLDRLKMLANTGYVYAQTYLAQAYATGINLPQDSMLARHYYQQASLAGNIDADYQLGLLAKNGGLNLLQSTGSFSVHVRQFFLEAYHAFLRSYLRGHAASSEELGGLYYCGYIQFHKYYAFDTSDHNVNTVIPVPKAGKIDHLIAAEYYINFLDLDPAAFHQRTQTTKGFLGYLKSIYPRMDNQNSEKFEKYCHSHNIQLKVKQKTQPINLEQILQQEAEMAKVEHKTIYQYLTSNGY